jgi:hypothetical protein
LIRSIGRSLGSSSDIKPNTDVGDLSEPDASENHSHRYATEPVAIPLLGLWQNFSALYQPPRLWTIGNFVQWEGVIKASSIDSAGEDEICTVPLDYRPEIAPFVGGFNSSHIFVCTASDIMMTNTYLPLTIDPITFTLRVFQDRIPPASWLPDAVYLNLNSVRYTIPK